MKRLAIIGPAVKMTNPMIHGSRKMNAQRVSSAGRHRDLLGAVALAAVMSPPPELQGYYAV
jgi:hypothetical protein